MRVNSRIDLERLKWDLDAHTSFSRKREKFLRGPIPLDWLAAAARLPGKSLHVAITIYFWQGIRRSHKVRLSMSLLKEFGVTRWAAYRGLDALERAGLVKLKRGHGKASVVEVIKYRFGGRHGHI
jgi:hypothetical protein